MEVCFPNFPPLVMSLSLIPNSIYWMCICSLSEILVLFVVFCLLVWCGWGALTIGSPSSTFPLSLGALRKVIQLLRGSVSWFVISNTFLAELLWRCLRCTWKTSRKTRVRGVIIICFSACVCQLSSQTSWGGIWATVLWVSEVTAKYYVDKSLINSNDGDGGR